MPPSTHTGGRSAGGSPGDKAHPAGSGTPPLADRFMSWTPAGPNGSVQFPDQRLYAKAWGHVPSPFGNFEYLNPDDEACGGADYCTVRGFPPDGTPPDNKSMPLADFVTYNDAIAKMRFVPCMVEVAAARSHAALQRHSTTRASCRRARRKR